MSPFIVSIVLALAFAAYGAHRLFFGYPRPQRSYACLAPREIAFVHAAIEAMFPARGAIPVAGTDVDAPDYVDRFLDVLHPAKRAQIRLLLCFFEQATFIWWAPRPRGWRRFSDLSLRQRIEVMHAWDTSRLFVRRIVFTALRSVLGLAYLGHPATMRFLRVAPFDFPSPIREADLLYPPIGKGPEAIRYGVADLSSLEEPEPIPLDSPIHPDYSETPL